ncbi:MAG: ABC transporter permease [Intestinibacter sp.]|uniref:ABC transporter permease n=2 Tax=Intestinibacter sp. TaxID=1965304 RepID=UPI002A7EA6E0|nr:ABC transporter permease [Intestinibacter sp.]MDY4575331.1 ABC transporter permease [Intestinibacter sp.]
MSRFFYFKLAITNIKKNAKTYVPYMITSILTISMFYIICSLGNNPNITKACGTDSMKYVLFLGTWVCGIFAVIFLFYTNSFLMKRRKKEFGLYNILGMEKKHISMVVLCETLIMSIISLVLGLVVGILFDKLMLLVILSMFTVEIPLGFHISPESFPATLTLFTGIFVLIFLNSIRQIHLAKPIELLQGSTVGEKEPKAKWLIALIGAICLGSGYYISLTLTTTNPIATLNMFFIAVILVIIGTYLLFTAGSIVLLKALRKNKNYYYKTKNFISISGMIYRMKQNAVGLANICVLSTMVLVMISSTFSLWNGMNDVLDNFYPREFIFTPFEYSEKSASDLKVWVKDTLDECNLEPKDIIDYSYLNFAVVQDKDSFIMYRDNPVYSDMINDIRNLFFITLDDYNKMTNSNETLKADEVLVYSNRDKYDYKEMKLSDKTFKVKETLDNFPNNRIMSSDVASSHFMIVKDMSVINDLDKIQNEIYGDMASSIQYYYAFNVDADTEKILDINNKFENDIQEMGTYGENTNKYVYEGRFDCRETEKNDFIGMYGGLYFIGVFLGVLFIIATILIMYYKQISEGYDDKSRFEIMQKVGISHEEIKKSIHSQVLTVFFLPLIVAGIHIAFAFPFITRLLAILNLTNVKLFAMATVGGFLLFSVFYAVVYRITARSYYKIVS